MYMFDVKDQKIRKFVIPLVTFTVIKSHMYMYMKPSAGL